MACCYSESCATNAKQKCLACMKTYVFMRMHCCQTVQIWLKITCSVLFRNCSSVTLHKIPMATLCCFNTYIVFEMFLDSAYVEFNGYNNGLWNRRGSVYLSSLFRFFIEKYLNEKLKRELQFVDLLFHVCTIGCSTFPSWLRMCVFSTF